MLVCLLAFIIRIEFNRESIVMNLLQMVLQNSGGSVVNQLAKQFNLDQDQATGALSALIPAINRGLSNTTSGASGESSGLETLMKLAGLVQGEAVMDDVSKLNAGDTVEKGNMFLQQLLGGKDASRNVAAHAAEQTGLDVSILKKMLPLAATVAMGAVSKKANNEGGIESLFGQSGAGSMLHSFLDADNDGSVMDDVLNLAKRLF